MNIDYKLINGRAETLAQKPSLRTAFKKRRCLIAADGFYEWKHSVKTKQPFYVQLKKGDVFGLAGLWKSWLGQDGNIVESCTIVTTSPNELIRGVHDRMPVILHPDQYEIWLEDSPSVQLLHKLLVPYPADEMKIYQVSSEVNSPQNDTPTCLTPI